MLPNSIIIFLIRNFNFKKFYKDLKFFNSKFQIIWCVMCKMILQINLRRKTITNRVFSSSIIIIVYVCIFYINFSCMYFPVLKYTILEGFVYWKLSSNLYNRIITNYTITSYTCAHSERHGSAAASGRTARHVPGAPRGGRSARRRLYPRRPAQPLRRREHRPCVQGMSLPLTGIFIKFKEIITGCR